MIQIEYSTLQPVPVGAIGELYIAGTGLSRGYLNRPDLTAERFIDNPFANPKDIADGHTKLYKTGDLVRWLPDGNIEFVGRNDFQVKIRGFRIELGEIEYAISKLDGIKQVVVLANNNQAKFISDKYLVAYYTVDAKMRKLANKETLRDWLLKYLPDYMIPSAFVELENFPLTASGKIDRKLLPEPEFTKQESYVAPRNEKEQQVCAIWQEILGLRRVGIIDDFFRIGGNSILAMYVSHKMGKIIHKHIPIIQIFQYRTISNILKNIQKNTGVKKIVLPRNLKITSIKR